MDRSKREDVVKQLLKVKSRVKELQRRDSKIERDIKRIPIWRRQQEQIRLSLQKKISKADKYILQLEKDLRRIDRTQLVDEKENIYSVCFHYFVERENFLANVIITRPDEETALRDARKQINQKISESKSVQAVEVGHIINQINL